MQVIKMWKQLRSILLTPMKTIMEKNYAMYVLKIKIDGESYSPISKNVMMYLKFDRYTRSLMHHYVNSSNFIQSWYPSTLPIAIYIGIITPVHKTGSKDSPANYHAITPLNIMCKISKL